MKPGGGPEASEPSMFGGLSIKGLRCGDPEAEVPPLDGGMKKTTFPRWKKRATWAFGSRKTKKAGPSGNDSHVKCSGKFKETNSFPKLRATHIAPELQNDGILGEFHATLSTTHSSPQLPTISFQQLSQETFWKSNRP